MRAIILLVATFCWARFLSADGTLSTSELLESLRPSNPALVKTLETGFDLDKDASGARIGRVVNATLAGTRIGPYTVGATLHGVPGAAPLTITLNTDLTFTNARGQRTSRVALATGVTEQLKSITIIAGAVTTGTP
jgi:hypothetical protein